MFDSRIGIATALGRPYYRFSNYLKTLNISFDSILPEDIMSYNGNFVCTTRKEFPKNCEKHMLDEEVLEHPPTVLRGKILEKLTLRYDEDVLLFGIDPGQRIGLSILYYEKEIENSFYSSIDDLVNHIIQVLHGLKASRKVVKIGNGNMDIAKKIVEHLSLKFSSSFELEFVDEKNTSLKIKNHNQRGKRDMLSAKYISQREGTRKSILPFSRIE